MSRKHLGRCAGAVGTLIVLFLWAGMLLPLGMVPEVGEWMIALMVGGVVLPGIAVGLDSKWWWLIAGLGIVTSVVLYIGVAA